MNASDAPLSREELLHALYEASELEHNLMCTYLYAAFSLRSGPGEGLSAEEAADLEGFRKVITRVAIEEMGHLACVWNITAALGGVPRFGRANFPLDPGILPAGIVVKLAPFSEAVIQHFVHLERPSNSDEPEGSGFEPVRVFQRGSSRKSLTPMGVDYDTVGDFYATLENELRRFADHHGQEATFCGDPAFQLTSEDTGLDGVTPVRCLKTAIEALDAIVAEGEGAAEHAGDSHFGRFADVRARLAELKAQRPGFEAAHPAATNPVLRRPVASGRVWIEDETAAATVDLANSAYALMLRFIAYSYAVPSTSPEKRLVIDLSLGLMRAMTALGERAARLPAGPSNPDCNAGMSFTTLRDAAPLPRGAGARRFFVERLTQLGEASVLLAADGDVRAERAMRLLLELVTRAESRLLAIHDGPAESPSTAAATASVPKAVPSEPSRDPNVSPTPIVVDGVEHVPGRHLTLMFDAKRCIHARFCVTGAPNVFLANVDGPWIRPDAVSKERLMEIAHACPSGAITYQRKDGGPDEPVPPVNLLTIREAGPYAVRAELDLDGTRLTRATLCRCGASKNKPFCDGSHHAAGFDASGEPTTRNADPLPERAGRLEVVPQVDGPLRLRGSVEILSGTGRVVERTTTAKLCRCGGSANKPFCDGTHTSIGFRSG